MAEILSQEEIDALLSSFSQGGDIPDVEKNEEEASDISIVPTSNADKFKGRKIAVYDFRRPERISKEQLRSLQNIHENYIRLFSTTLTGILRSVIETELIGVEQLTYQEFIMSIPNPAVLYTFELPPLEGTGILEMNIELVFVIIDKLLGGLGKIININRELTNLESQLIREIVVKALATYKQTWEHIVEFEPKILEYESNPQFVQVLPSTEVVILVTFEIKFQNEVSGIMSLCLPFMMLEPVLSKLSTQTWVRKKESRVDYKDKILQKLLDREVPVVAELDRYKIKLRDFLQLKEGDIIKLDKKITDPITIYVKNKKKFLGKLGVVKDHKAVKILKFIKED